MRLLPTIVLAVSAVALAGAAGAQPTSSIETVYARPGYPTVAVYVMGQVAAPGKWRVETNLPLLDLLAVTRPVGSGVETPGVEAFTRVRLFRQAEGDTRRLILESELEPLLTSAQAVTPLIEGDLVEVAVVVNERRRRFGLSDALSVMSAVASFASLVVFVTR